MGPGSSPVGWTCRCKPTWWDPNRGSSWGGSGWFIAKLVINQCSMLSWGCYIFCKPVCAYNIIIYIYIIVVAVYETLYYMCMHICMFNQNYPASSSSVSHNMRTIQKHVGSIGFQLLTTCHPGDVDPNTPYSTANHAQQGDARPLKHRFVCCWGC